MTYSCKLCSVSLILDNANCIFVYTTTRESCIKVTHYLFVVGVNPFPANQNVKYECYQCAIQISQISAGSVYKHMYQYRATNDLDKSFVTLYWYIYMIFLPYMVFHTKWSSKFIIKYHGKWPTIPHLINDVKIAMFSFHIKLCWFYSLCRYSILIEVNTV